VEAALRSKPNVGDVFTVPLPRGWWGAARLYEVSPGEGERDAPSFKFLVLDGFWQRLPTAADVRECPLLRGPFEQWKNSHHKPEWLGWFSERWPDTFLVVTRGRLSSADLERGSDYSGTVCYQSALGFKEHLHAHWRWVHEREALEADWKRSLERRTARSRAKAKARREGLSLAKLARERPFGHWKEVWSSEVVAETRRIFRVATRELIALEEGARKKEREAVIRHVVDSFNDLDAREACIETSEREQIIDRIEELARLVGLRNTNERLTGHRDW
tara:strand:- start:72 stop:896 length:825 start_codon:yes stop_codon:yes gene_type:complete